MYTLYTDNLIFMELYTNSNIIMNNIFPFCQVCSLDATQFDCTFKYKHLRSGWNKAWCINICLCNWKSLNTTIETQIQRNLTASYLIIIIHHHLKDLLQVVHLKRFQELSSINIHMYITFDIVKGYIPYHQVWMWLAITSHFENVQLLTSHVGVYT